MQNEAQDFKVVFFLLDYTNLSLAISAAVSASINCKLFCAFSYACTKLYRLKHS